MSLSPESIEMCKQGPFEEKDLVDFLPMLAGEIAEHGEHAVVERCQIARANCGNAGQAVDAVKRYYATPLAFRAQSMIARKAMSPEEFAVAFAA